MEELVKLRQQLEAVKAELRGLTTQDGLSADEFTTKAKEIQSRRDGLATKISVLEQVDADQRESAKEKAKEIDRQGRKTEEEKAMRSYSVTKAIRDASEGRQQSGLEREMADEADKEARESGISLSGQVRIPSLFMQRKKPTDMEGIERFRQKDWGNRQSRTTLVSGTGSLGGNTVQTELSSEMIPFLNPMLMVESMGARVLTGLTGPLEIARKNARSTAAWAGEIENSTEVNLTVDKVTLTPKRLTAWTPFSKQLLLQSSFDVEMMVREDLTEALAIALDLAAINGSGTGNVPKGILNYSGIGSVVGGTNGASVTWPFFTRLETALATANAPTDSLGYLTTPGVRGKAKETEKVTGSGRFIWEDTNQNTVNGYPIGISNQVPSTLTKGSSSGVCHAIIFGNWRELIIGVWGGLDLTVDNITLASQASVKVTVHSWSDIALRHDASFAAMKDALIS
jgi:HK97 family phage major capsid protein